MSRSESEEYIVGGIGERKGKDMPLEIWESREVDVEVDRGSVRKIGGLNANGTGEELRTKMYDGSGKEFESRTVVTAVASPLGRKSESGSRSD